MARSTSTGATVTHGDGDIASVADARRSTRDWLASQPIADDVAGRTLLVVSELVTNAVRHARTGWVLSLVRRPTGTVGVRVSDTGTGTPAIRLAPLDATSGRGLVLVAVMSEDWGWDPSPTGGKVVWAEVA
jgi:anti-sigma regulatory factor (Ser/Thr protein kinase)